MKKSLMFALIVGFAFSCKDNDDKKNVDVEGKWQLLSVVISNCPDPGDNDETIDSDGCDDDDCTTVEFDDGTWTWSETWSGDSESGTYKVSGSKLTLEGETYTATRSGDTLTLTYEYDGCSVVESYTLIE